MPFLLTLHMTTPWDAEHRLKGQRDVSLSDAGFAEAEQFAQTLRGRGIAWVLCSDLARSRQTGEVIARELSVPIQCDARLRECAFGQLEGCTEAEAVERFGASARSARESGYLAYDFRPFGGEHRDAVFGRHRDALREYAGDVHRAAILVVGHHCGLNTLLAGIPTQAGTLERGEVREIAASAI